MRRFLERCLMFVIILALPLQGLAAATMFHCGPAQAGEHSAADPGHRHADPAASHHHHGEAPDAHSAHAAAATSEAGDADQQAPLSKCSACASCCTASALPSAPMVIASPELPQSFTAHDATRVESFVTHGPERPPRPFLA